ncbi:MAG: GTPase [archaeon]|nr:50S ribosome-binding GTPase [Candidatus Micrarchaeota archaeon]
MGFRERVERVIGKSDLLLEIVDSRFPNETRNELIEERVKEKKKELIIVVNKSDLVSKRNALKVKKELSKFFRVVFVSGKEKKGISRLRNAIKAFAGRKEKKVVVGVIGYPNTGKSSIINALKGKVVARTSITAGYTKGEQFISLTKNVLLVDSPGIIPFEERDELLLALVGAKNPSKLEDAESAAEKVIELLMENNPKKLERRYGIELKEKNAGEVLEWIAMKKGRLLKKGIPDVNAVSKQIVLEWQKGKL